MEYTWKVVGIKKLNTDELSDVIVQTYWEKTGTNENNITGTFVGATPFSLDSIDPDNFVSYENLTEEIVINWIKSFVIDDYEKHVNSMIDKQIQSKINPVVEVTNNFPWPH